MSNPCRAITEAQVRKLYLGNVSRTTFWRLRKRDNSFPRKLSYSYKTLFDQRAVDAWYEANKRPLGGSKSLNMREVRLDQQA